MKTKTTTTTTSIHDIVSKKIKEAWKTVFTSKKRAKSFDHKVFKIKRFKMIRNKIKNQDTELTKEVNVKELNKIVKNLSNSTAAGLDNILNKIIKVLCIIEEFEMILVKIMNICIINKKIPNK